MNTPDCENVFQMDPFGCHETEDGFDEVEEFILLIEKDPTILLDNVSPEPKKAKRIHRERINLWDREWGKLIRSEEVRDPLSFEGKKFRLRFRVPFSLFAMQLVPACKEANIFKLSRNSVIPIEFKILVALRILGRDHDSDTISELSGIKPSSCNSFFKQFVLGFAEAFAHKFITFPTGSDLDEVQKTFAKVGFPGACGSMDVTHFRWDACPKQHFNLCKGKYSFPTLAVQAVVDHNRRILYVTSVYDGRENDKLITNNDEFTIDVMRGGLLKNVSYMLYDVSGRPMLCRGGYILVDGGYQKLQCFIDPSPGATGTKEVHWSEFLESIRKDVECTFGIIKKRFRWLKNPIAYQSREVISAAVKTACVLHNMLLAYDGLDESEWNVDWVVEDPLMPDEDIVFHNPERMEEENAIVEDQPPQLLRDTTPVGPQFDASVPQDYTRLRCHLVEHFYHQHIYGQLQWPRRFGSESKRALPMKDISERTNKIIYDALYSKESDMRVASKPEGANTIGLGIFCSLDLQKSKRGIALATFVGEIITRVEGANRSDSGRGGYQLRLSADCILDCYDTCRRGECKASLCNSATGCIDVRTGTAAQNNCEIRVFNNQVRLYTRVNTFIPRHTELLYPYSNAYHFHS